MVRVVRRNSVGVRVQGAQRSPLLALVEDNLKDIVQGVNLRLGG